MAMKKTISCDMEKINAFQSESTVKSAQVDLLAVDFCQLVKEVVVERKVVLAESQVSGDFSLDGYQKKIKQLVRAYEMVVARGDNAEDDIWATVIAMIG